MKHVFSFLCALAATVLAVLAEALVICSSCGTEAAPGARFCAHCGAALAGAAPAAPVSAAAPVGAPVGARAPAASAADLAVIGRKAAQECVQAARSHLKDGRADVAKALYANALAIAGIDPGVLTPAQGEKLQEEARMCDQQLSMIRAECPVCQGSGRKSLSVTSLGGSTAGAQTSTVASGIRCNACGGTGKTLRRRTVGERKAALGLGTRQAETTFRSLGFIQEGNAWIPQELVPALTLELRCRLRRAAAAPCPDCQGFGLTDCRKCGSTGYTPCKARGCVNGWVTEDPVNSLDSKSVALKKRVACPVCGGTAKVACETCSGRGAQTCSKCQGSGRRNLCNACGGEGTGPCPTCHGTGETKATAKEAAAPCPACGGTGRGFCKSCHGDGYR